MNAIVLAVAPYRDSDLIVTLLTAEAGKVSAAARSARNSRKRFGGALEAGAVLAVEFSRSGRGMAQLTDAQAEANLLKLRGNLVAIAEAAYGCELARELAPEDEPCPELYTALLEHIERLNGAGPHAASLARAQQELLSAQGYAPVLDRCVRCAVTDQSMSFSAAEGGVVCDAHRQPGDLRLTGDAALERALHAFATHIIGRDLKSYGVLQALRKSA